MKKKISIFTIIGIIFIVLNVININTTVQATTQSTVVQDGGGADYFDPDFYKPGELTTNDTEKVVKKVGIILGTVRNISVIVSVIVLMIIGFKYIIGSASEKANYKATMVPYIIGCVMAVAGTTIVSFIYNSIH